MEKNTETKKLRNGVAKTKNEESKNALQIFYEEFVKGLWPIWFVIIVLFFYHLVLHSLVLQQQEEQEPTDYFAKIETRYGITAFCIEDDLNTEIKRVYCEYPDYPSMDIVRKYDPKIVSKYSAWVLS